MKFHASVSFALIIVYFSTSLYAVCPCDSLTTDIRSISNTDFFNTPDAKLIRISKCIKCRENLGLHYFFCNTWLRDNLNKGEDSKDVNHPEIKYLMLKVTDYGEECDKNEFIDIDSHMRGQGLIAGGFGVLSAGIAVNCLSKRILKWGFNNKSAVGDGALFDGLVYVFSMVISLVATAIGIIADAGSIAMITVGSQKVYTYKTFQIEFARFKIDMEFLGISVQ